MAQPANPIIRSLTPLYPPFADLLQKGLTVARASGLNVYAYETWRSASRQESLYAQGRSTPGAVVTNSRAGQSFHAYGLGTDIVFGGPGAWSWEGNWKALASAMESVGLEWAGRWKHPESPHFQKTWGLTIEEAQAIAKIDGPLAVWLKLDAIRAGSHS